MTVRHSIAKTYHTQPPKPLKNVRFSATYHYTKIIEHKICED